MLETSQRVYGKSRENPLAGSCPGGMLAHLNRSNFGDETALHPIACALSKVLSSTDFLQLADAFRTRLDIGEGGLYVTGWLKENSPALSYRMKERGVM
jgi:hypothetical protein